MSSTHTIYAYLTYYYRPINLVSFFFFFFNDTATTEIYTLSLHDALPISQLMQAIKLLQLSNLDLAAYVEGELERNPLLDRKSTRLNSSHANISYAVFCLKKKKKTNHKQLTPCNKQIGE